MTNGLGWLQLVGQVTVMLGAIFIAIKEVRVKLQDVEVSAPKAYPRLSPVGGGAPVSALFSGLTLDSSEVV